MPWRCAGTWAPGRLRDTVTDVVIQQAALVLRESHPIQRWSFGRLVSRVLERFLPEELERFIAANKEYQAELSRHVHGGYSRELIDELLEDERLSRTLTEQTAASQECTRQYPWMGGMGTPMPLWMLIPRFLYRDRSARTRLRRTLDVIKEVRESLTRLQLQESESEAAHEQDGLLWQIYDPEIPTEVSERIVAAYRARVAFDLATEAHRAKTWTESDIRAAFFDWARWVEYSMVLVASIPEASVPSLPGELLLDPGHLEELQRGRRDKLAEQAERVAAAHHEDRA